MHLWGHKSIMKMNKFHQSTGFTPIDFPDVDGAGDTWLTNAGFLTTPIIEDGKTADYKFMVYPRAPGDQPHEFSFIALIVDPQFTQQILVNNEADLLALRLRVAPLLRIKT